MKKRIADILLTQGAINSDQLRECETLSHAEGTSVERCLLLKSYVEQERLARAYAEYAGLPFQEKISDNMADLDLLARVPLKFLRDNVVMPIKKDDQLTIVTADPLNFQPVDELNLLLGGQAQIVVSTEQKIIEAINRYYPMEGTKQMIEELGQEEEGIEEVDLGGIDEKDIMSMATEAPIIKLVNHIMFQAVKRGASDIHLEPFEKEISVRFRIDGVMQHIMSPPKRIQSALVSRIKIMANLNIAEKRIPQDGRINIKVAGKAIDIRVSILPVNFGERVVMRLLDKSRTFGKLEDLKLTDRDHKILTDNIQKPNGIIYVTGPTGSGKTTTLYTILGALNDPDVNIITVEDPVEYQMGGIGQVQVREKVGLTFAAALRSILRQDPDIVMIGETRDQETAQIAIQAALTGHLVLSTLHTNSAPASITRLIDMGIEPFLIASSLIVCIAQRLVRRLCASCKKPYKPEQKLLEKIGMSAQEASHVTFFSPQGCEQCSHTGYKGRLAVFELMEMTPGIARLTMMRADTGELRKQAVADGMTLLLNDGVRKIKEGQTTIDEVLSVAALDQDVIEV